MSKKKDDLLEKIKIARQRRAARGITSQQLDKMHLQGSKVKSVPNKNNVTRPASRPSKMLKLPQTSACVFISGGIGDVFAVESFLSESERRAITTIYYGTHKMDPVSKLFASVPNYRNLENQISVWNDFSKFWCFYTVNECISRLISSNKKCPDNLRSSRDLGIMPSFEDIKKGRMKFTGSSFLKYKLADINRFSIQQKYAVICPYSTDKRIEGRDFNSSDWLACLEMLKLMGLKGIILNNGGDDVPKSPELINLANNTEITEAVEILKSANAYIGIDTGMSVLASQLFHYPNLVIKSRNQHLYSNMECYYSPHKSFDFVNREIIVPESFRKKSN